MKTSTAPGEPEQRHLRIRRSAYTVKGKLRIRRNKERGAKQAGVCQILRYAAGACLIFGGRHCPILWYTVPNIAVYGHLSILPALGIMKSGRIKKPLYLQRRISGPWRGTVNITTISYKEEVRMNKAIAGNGGGCSNT